MVMYCYEQIEIDDGQELTAEFLYEEIHPKTTIVKQQFSKPPGPTRRGPKRMTQDE